MAPYKYMHYAVLRDSLLTVLLYSLRYVNGE